MEDYILREIDRLGEMLMLIARRLGLLDGDTLDYSLADVKDEFDKAACPIDLDAMLAQKNPVWYLVETGNPPAEYILSEPSSFKAIVRSADPLSEQINRGQAHRDRSG